MAHRVISRRATLRPELRVKRTHRRLDRIDESDPGCVKTLDLV
jgi:hypothetical protein